MRSPPSRSSIPLSSGDCQSCTLAAVPVRRLLAMGQAAFGGSEQSHIPDTNGE